MAQCSGRTALSDGHSGLELSCSCLQGDKCQGPSGFCGIGGVEGGWVAWVRGFHCQEKEIAGGCFGGGGVERMGWGMLEESDSKMSSRCPQ